MKWVKSDFICEGKGKSLYKVKNHPQMIWMEFKESLTAFNGKKKSSFKGKGALNRDTSSLAFRFLEKQGIKTHWVEDMGKTAMICKPLKIIPLEVVVRNRLAGSTALKFQFPEGKTLLTPLVEFYYKNDNLGDPFLSMDQAISFHFVTGREEAELLKAQALKVNRTLKKFFNLAGIELIDFKLEFGKLENSNKNSPPLLADEVSCDTCRLWDKQTGEKMDKDRFRLNLGGVKKAYKTVRDTLRDSLKEEF